MGQFGLLHPGWPLVREKSGKFDFSSRSGKSQGILQIGQGDFKYQESRGKVREFHLSATRRQIGRKTAVFWSVKN